VGTHAGTLAVAQSLRSANTPAWVPACAGMTKKDFPIHNHRWVPRWKIGFWKIARQADVPIVLVYLHSPDKVVGVAGTYLPTGDMRGTSNASARCTRLGRVNTTVCRAGLDRHFQQHQSIGYLGMSTVISSAPQGFQLAVDCRMTQCSVRKAQSRLRTLDWIIMSLGLGRSAARFTFFQEPLEAP